MQDSSRGRQPVWENRAAPRLRKGLLPRSECDPLRVAAGGVPNLDDSVVSPASLIFFLKVFLMPSRSLPPHCWEAKVSWKPLGWNPPAPWALGPRNLLVSVWEAGWGDLGGLSGGGLRVDCVGSVRLLVVAF